MGCQSSYYSLVTFFKCSYSFTQFLVLTFALLFFTSAELFLLTLDGSDVRFRDRRDGWGRTNMNTGAETSVLFF